MSLIRNPKDFGSGCLFAGFGLVAVVLGATYPAGTAARMGPGYFPRALGIILIVLGTILIVKSLRTTGARISLPTLKPLVVVLASSVASHEFRWKEATIASVVLAAFVVAVFGYGLKLQLPILPAFLGGN